MAFINHENFRHKIIFTQIILLQSTHFHTCRSISMLAGCNSSHNKWFPLSSAKVSKHTTPSSLSVRWSSCPSLLQLHTCRNVPQFSFVHEYFTNSYFQNRLINVIASNAASSPFHFHLDMLEVRGHLPQMGKPDPQKYYYTQYYNTKILLHKNFQIYGSTQVQQ